MRDLNQEPPLAPFVASTHKRLRILAHRVYGWATAGAGDGVPGGAYGGYVSGIRTTAPELALVP